MMKPFTAIAVAFLSLMALLQLGRFLLGWEIVVHGVAIPVWFSGIAFVVVGALAAMLWRESRRQ
jgi:membrane protein implicated in regulation of membrane protease activity